MYKIPTYFMMVICLVFGFNHGVLANSLSILNWNISQSLPERPRHIKNNRIKIDHFADDKALFWQEFSTNIQADIVIFQEVNDIPALMRFYSNDYEMMIGGDLHDMNTAFGISRDLIANEGFSWLQPAQPMTNINVNGRLRNGVMASFRLFHQEFHLLAIHLKAYCAQQAITSKTDDCELLKQQNDELKQWILKRKSDKATILLIGDFNRRLHHEPNAIDDDSFMGRLVIHDGNKPSDEWLILPQKQKIPQCHPHKFSSYIDFVLMNATARGHFNNINISELTEPFSSWSDHCPLFLTLNW